MNTKEFTLIYPWDTNGYCPDVRYVMGVDKAGFTMHITVPEANPRRVMTHNFQPVCLDSCVEWFVNFLPEKNDGYFNFETNALGTINVSFQKKRLDPYRRPLTEQEIASLQICADIYEDHWEISYRVPFALIRSYIPDYRFREGMTIRANFYKCGGHTQFVHHGVWNAIPIDKPDFHRPEYFGEIVLADAPHTVDGIR